MVCRLRFVCAPVLKCLCRRQCQSLKK
uniref:Uncharacterized protein n=1 Tax=Anguilla anguilla TaxID=7936 RepID=A0A0E9SCZ1_ANGAN